MEQHARLQKAVPTTPCDSQRQDGEAAHTAQEVSASQDVYTQLRGFAQLRKFRSLPRV